MSWRFIQTLRVSPSAGILIEGDNHPAIAAQTLHEIPALQGNLIHDVHITTLKREHGVRTIFTRDTDFHRFSFLEAQDPLQQP